MCVCVCVSGFTGSNMCDNMCDIVLQGSAVCVCVYRCVCVKSHTAVLGVRGGVGRSCYSPLSCCGAPLLVLIVTPSSFISPALSYYFLASFTAVIYYSNTGLNMFFLCVCKSDI